VTARRVVEFCRFARAHGLSAGVAGTLDALQAAAVAPPETLRFALRGVLSSSKEEWERFDALFEAFWGGRRAGLEPVPKNDRERTEGGTVWALSGAVEGPVGDREGKAVAGASLHERLRKTDFSQVPQSDQPALEQIAQRLLHQTSWRLSRRLKSAEPRGPIDLRRTIRRSIPSGGDPIELRYKSRKPNQARLVILVDVSGSMNLYSVFLLRFAHALEKHFKRAETFVFATSLVDVTGALRSRQLPDALQELARTTAGWSGGTRIGESLRDFNRHHARRSLSRDTLFIMLSDGWDTGEPEVLASELHAIKRRVRKLIWLNPLLGLENYQPVTRGMTAALPHVDVFAPAHCLQSLMDLEKHLARTARR